MMLALRWLFVSLCAILLSFCQPAHANTAQWIVYKTKNKISLEIAQTIVSSVYKHALDQGVDPDLIFKIITIESNFNRHAISPKNARGLMQIMPRYHKQRYRGENIHDIDINIRVGIEILLEYQNSTYCKGDQLCSLRRYYGSLRSNAYGYKVLSVKLPEENIYPKEEFVEVVKTNQQIDYLDHDIE